MIVLEWDAAAADVIIVMDVKIGGTHIRCHSEGRADGVAHQDLGSHQKNLLDVAAILVAVEVEGTDVEDTGIIQTIRVGLIFKLISLVSMGIMPDGLCHPVGDVLILLAVVDVDVGIITDLLKQYLLNLEILPVKFIATGDRVDMIIDVPDTMNVEDAVLTVAVLIVAAAGRKEEGGCARDLIHRVLHLLDLSGSALPVKVITTEDCVDVPFSLDDAVITVALSTIAVAAEEEKGGTTPMPMTTSYNTEPTPTTVTTLESITTSTVLSSSTTETTTSAMTTTQEITSTMTTPTTTITSPTTTLESTTTTTEPTASTTTQAFLTSTRTSSTESSTISVETTTQEITTTSELSTASASTEKSTTIGSSTGTTELTTTYENPTTTEASTTQESTTTDEEETSTVVEITPTSTVMTTDPSTSIESSTSSATTQLLTTTSEFATTAAGTTNFQSTTIEESTTELLPTSTDVTTPTEETMSMSSSTKTTVEGQTSSTAGIASTFPLSTELIFYTTTENDWSET
ncbi:hypothetical protein CAEBREN_25634 [Caenorhabditis brenneri]|uniref:Uncharacterized protein n=1 Tax=Caenorhabditis brenneri TaxID=135651 RepID=G0N6N7_CAEBE|nr:hypothetical protein CAEBREN_25634 [Caenorhabditis brenneri]